MGSDMKRRTQVSWSIRPASSVVSTARTSVVIVAILFTFWLILLVNHLPSELSASNPPTISYWNRGHNNNLSTLCPLVSPLSVGWMDLSFIIPELLEDSKQDTAFYTKMKSAALIEGGSYRPKDCQSRNKVAIILPYRNRSQHLTVFLRYMHPFLQRQQLDYTVFVVEQTADGLPFNRGMLLNVGFVEAQRSDTFQCFIFHDIDILPEDDRNVYSCPEVGKPRHMSFVIDVHDYKPVSLMFLFGGGVIAVSAVDFVRTNGYSNAFWGLGLEDDDFYRRIRRLNMSVARTNIPAEHLRYRTLYHDPSVDLNPNRQKLFDDGYLRFDSDGLINLKYRLTDMQLKPLYTHVVVELTGDNLQLNYFSSFE